MNAAASLLLNILAEKSQLPQYQPRFLWSYGPKTQSTSTSCNLFARDVLDSRFKLNPAWAWAQGIGGLIDAYDYDITPINHGKSHRDVILNTPIPVAYMMLNEAIANRVVTEHIAETAQAAANEGRVIHAVSSKYGHEAIIAPDDSPYDPARGPLLGQAGSFCGIIYLGDRKTYGAFGPVEKILADILFVEYRTY